MFCFALVLERLQSFLPQMAKANEKLKQQMEEAPTGCFDIENVEEAQKVIEMVRGTNTSKYTQNILKGFFKLWLSYELYLSCSQDVALVELSGSESDFEDKDDLLDSEKDSDSDDEHKITEQNLKLPGDKDKTKKANIQVLDQKVE